MADRYRNAGPRAERCLGIWRTVYMRGCLLKPASSHQWARGLASTVGQCSRCGLNDQVMPWFVVTRLLWFYSCNVVTLDRVHYRTTKTTYSSQCYMHKVHQFMFASGWIALHICGLCHKDYVCVAFSVSICSKQTTRARISNYTYHKMWNGITYPFPNINGATVEVWKWISNFIPQFSGHVITYPFWGWS